MHKSMILAALSVFSVCFGTTQELSKSDSLNKGSPKKNQACLCPMDFQGHYQVQNAYDITMAASALYWQTREQGLDYVIANAAGTTNLSNAGNVQRAHFDWDWGFRIDLGYQIPTKKMDLDLCWTRFITEGSNTDEANVPATLFSVWSVPTTLAYEYTAHAYSHLSLNVLDLGIRSTFSPRTFLDITPFVDLSTVWIHQHFLFRLSGGPGNSHVTLDDRIEMRNHYWGIGPKIGMDTLWNLGYGIGICGNLNLSLLYGLFHVKQNETAAFSGLTPSPTYLDIERNVFQIARLNLDFLIGLRWDKMFRKDSYRLVLEAGWENMIFLGQNQLMRFQNTSNAGMNVVGQGDLTIQGLSMRAALTF